MWSSSRAVAGLVLIALAAGCDSPTEPSPIPTQPSEHQAQPGQNRLDLAGPYTLTVSASSRCRLDLPETMRTRRYPATIAHADGWLLVTVHSPMNYPGIWNDIGRFTGVFGENDDVVFDGFGFDEWFPKEPNSEFTAFGSMKATVSAGGLSGLLDGFMRGIVPNEDGRGNRVITCTAPDHEAMLSR